MELPNGVMPGHRSAEGTEAARPGPPAAARRDGKITKIAGPRVPPPLVSRDDPGRRAAPRPTARAAGPRIGLPSRSRDDWAGREPRPAAHGPRLHGAAAAPDRRRARARPAAGQLSAGFARP
ncbi:hypothetical protein GCM10010191_03990 [Actinomadura vinacea]|uniref:Uncharacterized protein n=1 Tax=Actinomadura vinacea TaxID=115336 RepID=A0ABN3ID98_9ACTN